MERGGGRARELQGPRPAALKVRKDKQHKMMRKPPVPHAQVRQPVIIYTVSPKVVHASPTEFMSVVQRLTGSAAPAASSSTLPLAPPFPFQLQAPHEQAATSSPARNAVTAGGALPPVPPASFFSPPAGGINQLGEPISPAFLDPYNSIAGAAPMLHYCLPGPGAPSPSPPGAAAYHWDLSGNNHQYYNPNPNL